MVTLSKASRFALIFVAIGVAVGVGIALALTPRGDEVYQRIAEDVDDNPWLNPEFLKTYQSKMRIGSHYKSIIGQGHEGFFYADAKGGKEPYSYEWAFQDGVVLTQQNSTRTFDSLGDWTVKLTVTDTSQPTQKREQLLTFKVVPESEVIKAQPPKGLQP